MKKILMYIWYKFIILVFKLFPIKRNRILIENFYGKGYGDSPKYIANELLKIKDLEIIWLVKDKYYEDIPKRIKQVKRGTFSELLYLATSKIWIDNARKPLGLKKRKNQFYIQTWHSPLRLKKIEMDAKENLNSYYIKVMKNDSKNIDLMIAGCDFSYNIYKNSFLYDGKIAKFGTPRCDIFFDKKYCLLKRNEICDIFKINRKDKIILYAPTFRKNVSFSKIMPNLDEIYKTLAQKENITILYRFHPNTTTDYKTTNKKIIDVTKYSDMQDLLCATDMLITDYSSCSFDMVIAKKPCILYTPDLDLYLKEERNLYFKFDELPFEISKNEKELIKKISSFDRTKYCKRINAFDKRVNIYEDGNSTSKIVNYICEVINYEKI